MPWVCDTDNTCMTFLHGGWNQSNETLKKKDFNPTQLIDGIG